MTAEIADGWLPIFFIPERANDVWGARSRLVAAKRDPSLGELMITAGGLLAIGEGDDVTALREFAATDDRALRRRHGRQGQELLQRTRFRYGFEKEAATIQDLYLDGKKKEAEAAVPDEFLELTTCADRRVTWPNVCGVREAGVTHLQVHPIPLGDQSAATLIDAVKAMA